MAKITKKTSKHPIIAKTAEKPLTTKVAKQSSERPLGVTILCALGYAGAILIVLAGIAMIAFGGITSSLGVIGALLGGVGVIAGVILLAMGIITFAVSYGLWNLEKWAWNVAIILEGLSVLGNLMTMSIVGIIIPAVIMYYLYTQKEIFH